MDNAFARLSMWALYLVLLSALSLLTAFPFKWCWNYGMTYTFGLPYIGWGHAFCLIWILSYLKTSIVTHEANYKK